MHVKKRELCLRKHLNVYFQWQPRVSVCCLAFKARLIPSAHQATQGWRGREMDSLLSCTDSLGLARIAVHSELTSCYQLFSCGRDWNKQSRGLIHCVCAMPGGISGVIKCSPSDISIFHTSLEFARCFSTCCGPETDSWDLTGTTGTFLWVSWVVGVADTPEDLAAALFPFVVSGKQNSVLCARWSSRSHPSTASKLKVTTSFV